MEVISDSPEGLQKALEVLTNGGVVAHATETCYGLACDLSNPKAVEQLFILKQRPLTQPVSGLFMTVEDAQLYVDWNDLAEELAAAHLPGPLTLILKLRSDAPKQLFPIPAGNMTIGIRVSPHPTAIGLSQQFGSPLSTTSANVHGYLDSYSAQDIVDQFTSKLVQPDLIIDSGNLAANPPSRIIDVSTGVKKTVR